ncbi:hypothetical protein TCA2_4476 [Paenibacillus sp. TCA20]|uniref:Uncharacterized protein n=1 Tax=Paenibacillus urinalis TaxID=521520 RepID=A0ABY7XK83_9BACL|nr:MULTISPECIES: hypothetical protein [Paenibacillus]WDI05189.1 hypothetical protein PUW25_25610 [Paenibacillus urinalis]GAK41984.1 hypothetical protein TCA2_4476 [Paenibacillus sp. TCA20]
MDNKQIIRYFMKPIQNNFALVVATRSKGDIIIEEGPKPFVKGKYTFYSRDRQALENKVEEVLSLETAHS